MYKHECVMCLKNNYGICKFNIGFWDRFLGNDNVKFCPEYLKIMNNNIFKNRNGKRN